MSTTQYIGPRIIPVFAPDVEWDNTKTYDALTMVQHQGETFMSRQYVPAGIPLPDSTQDEEYNDFWVHMSNWNAQIEAYRQEVLQYNGRISTLETDLPISEFDSENTVSAKITNLENGLVIRPIVFSTVADMKSSTALESGMIVQTTGFRSTGDGGEAWYVISNAGTANEMDVIACGELFAILIVTGDQVTLEEFGAYGDGIHDDGAVFDYVVSNHDYIHLFAKTYKMTFGKTNLAGKTIKGEGAKSQLPGGTIIEAVNEDTPFCVVGKYTDLEDFSIKSHNNTRATAILLFGHDGVSFVRNDYHIVRNIDIACDDYSRAIMFNLVGTDSNPVGGIGGLIDNINIFGSDKGVYIYSDSSYSWLTETTISNILVYAPKTAGFEINVTEPVQVSQCVVNDFTVDLINTDSIGFKLSPKCAFMYNNLITFVDAAPGSSNHKGIDFGDVDFGDESKLWLTPFITNAQIEGSIENIVAGYNYVTNGIQQTYKFSGDIYATPNLYMLEPPSILIGGKLTTLYDDASYSSNVSIDGGLTLTKSKNIYHDDLLTIANSLTYTGLFTYQLPLTLPADISYGDWITVYVLTETFAPVIAYFGNGATTVESNNAFHVPTQKYPNRGLAFIHFKLSDYSSTAVGGYKFGIRVPGSSNVEILKIDALIGKLNMAKLIAE